MKASRLDLADSALHAPSAGFEDQDFYPDIVDKAAVLTCRLAWNHPLPDGNKRAAWASLVMFIDLNDGVWDPDPPNVDEAEAAMLAAAAHEVDEAELADVNEPIESRTESLLNARNGPVELTSGPGHEMPF